MFAARLPPIHRSSSHDTIQTAAFVIGADKAGQAYEAQRYDPGKRSEELELEKQLFGKRADDQVALTSTSDRALHWVRTHRYQTVAGAWAASMAGSFAYGPLAPTDCMQSSILTFYTVASQPLSFAQKLVQVSAPMHLGAAMVLTTVTGKARMLAQGLTVGVLLVTAGLAAGDKTPAQKAAQEARAEDAIYKFKKDSRKSSPPLS